MRQKANWQQTVDFVDIIHNCIKLNWTEHTDLFLVFLSLDFQWILFYLRLPWFDYRMFYQININSFTHLYLYKHFKEIKK